MSRDLRFRAWNKKGKCWITFGGVNYRYENGTLDIADNSNLIYEQCTGLKDKNGKEIYEGDVLESTWNGDKAVVIWNDVEGEWEHYADFNTHSKYSGSVVIGNIHENPELIGGEE